MGLDISVYVQAEEVDEGDDTIRAYIVSPSFSRSLRGLKEDAYYRARCIDSFSAGSYGGYNRWRNELSQRAVGVDAETVWDDAEAFTDSPFYELINFADNEGTIGPEAAADLASDFSENRAHVVREGDEWFAELYGKFEVAFKIAAATNGIVRFA